MCVFLLAIFRFTWTEPPERPSLEQMDARLQPGKAAGGATPAPGEPLPVSGVLGELVFPPFLFLVVFLWGWLVVGSGCPLVLGGF